jgi:hypothetical protein
MSDIGAAHIVHRRPTMTKKPTTSARRRHEGLGGPYDTISEALNWGEIRYMGEDVEIDTNVQLEELFEIMNTSSFEPLLHNLYRLTLNGIEIDAQSFKKFVIWHADGLPQRVKKG